MPRAQAVANTPGKPSQALSVAVVDPNAPVPESPVVSKTTLYDSPLHLLHGVLHYNGFGHLARINGAPTFLTLKLGS